MDWEYWEFCYFVRDDDAYFIGVIEGGGDVRFGNCWQPAVPISKKQEVLRLLMKVHPTVRTGAQFARMEGEILMM